MINEQECAHRGSNERPIADSIMRPDSPCIGYCSTTIGDDKCRGCGRDFKDVLDWNTMSPDQKKIIWARIEAEAYGIRWR